MFNFNSKNIKKLMIFKLANKFYPSNAATLFAFFIMIILEKRRYENGFLPFANLKRLEIKD